MTRVAGGVEPRQAGLVARTVSNEVPDLVRAQCRLLM
jgi:hypothetical protein